MLFACFVLTGARSFAQTDAPVRMDEAVDLTAKQNRNLKLANLNVIGMEHKKEEAHSAYFPHIRNDSKMTYITELAGVVIPAGAFGDHSSTGLIPSRELFIDQASSLSYTGGTSLDQPLAQLFRVRETNRASASDMSRARIEVERDQNDVILKVRQVYYQILIAQLREQADLDQVSASEVKAAENESDVSHGNALAVCSMESRAAVLEAKQAALTEKLEIRDLTMTLADMLGLPVHANLQLDSSDLDVGTVTRSRSECLRIARERSPDLRLVQQTSRKCMQACLLLKITTFRMLIPARIATVSRRTGSGRCWIIDIIWHLAEIALPHEGCRNSDRIRVYPASTMIFVIGSVEEATAPHEWNWTASVAYQLNLMLNWFRSLHGISLCVNHRLPRRCEAPSIKGRITHESRRNPVIIRCS